MKIGLVGFPGSGKTSVFGALTGLPVETGFAGKRGRPQLGTVKVPDARVDALAKLFEPKKVTYAEVAFTDLGGGSEGLDRGALNAMRSVDALCQVVRGFPDVLGKPPEPGREIAELETESLLADLEVLEQRIGRLRKDRSDPTELALLERLVPALESEQTLRRIELGPEEERRIAGYAFLTRKPLLVVLNTSEETVADAAPEEVLVATKQRGLGVVTLSAPVERDIAQMPVEDQAEFVASLGLEEPARHRFIRAAYELIDLVSMLTAGPDECRAWPITRGTSAARAAGKIHSDIERGFIRAEVIRWEDLVQLGSEARCREAGKLRVEGRDYIVEDGDVVHFRFNV